MPTDGLFNKKTYMNEKQIIYDLVKEVREEQKDIKNDISDIKQVLSVNTASLQEHMKRSDTLEKLYMSQQVRIDALEEPSRLRSALLKRFIKISGILTAIAGLIAAIMKISQ